MIDEDNCVRSLPSGPDRLGQMQRLPLLASESKHCLTQVTKVNVDTNEQLTYQVKFFGENTK